VIEASMREMIDHIVDGIPGVIGALIATTDGFLITSRLPENDVFDPSAVAAMSASTLALGSRLVQLGGPTPAKTVLHRSAQAQVCVFAVGSSAVLTIVAESRADTERIERVGYEVSWGLVRVLEQEPPPA
jgi:predicted regulator of Ras-like GTPase activity (Roadblock/LC7/MglB family)